MSTNQPDTVERILNAATILFAERGFAETSLRTITGMADVNLAAVNYHFGSKKQLIQAVFERFFQPFCQTLDEKLDTVRAADEQPSLETLLTLLLSTLLETMDSLEDKSQRFMKLIGLAYNQSQQHLRDSIVTKHRSTYDQFAYLLRIALPELDPVSFYWRLYFMLGAAVFTLSSYDPLRAILNEEYGEDMSMENTVALMVPALAGMLRSPNA